VRKEHLVEYHVWREMRQRCLNQRNKNWPYYGGRGIQIHSAWNSFELFFKNIGPRPSSLHTLERKNNSGDYEPGNVCWATREVQANNRRSTIRITHDGVTMTRAEWARKLGIPYFTLRSRMDNYGWSFAQAITMQRWKRIRK